MGRKRDDVRPRERTTTKNITFPRTDLTRLNRDGPRTSPLPGEAFFELADAVPLRSIGPDVCIRFSRSSFVPLSFLLRFSSLTVYTPRSFAARSHTFHRYHFFSFFEETFGFLFLSSATVFRVSSLFHAPTFFVGVPLSLPLPLPPFYQYLSSRFDFVQTSLIHRLIPSSTLSIPLGLLYSRLISLSFVPFPPHISCHCSSIHLLSQTYLEKPHLGPHALSFLSDFLRQPIYIAFSPSPPSLSPSLSNSFLLAIGVAFPLRLVKHSRTLLFRDTGFHPYLSGT